jgi:ABC-type nitrate/sulfonate/bicarbonate transport system substrate-binding protein
MAVDAVDTAFALLLYKMLDLKGIKRSEYDVKPVGGSLSRYQAMIKDKTYAASMLNPPFSLQALHAGLKDFGSAVSVIGPYQSDGGWVLRSWGQANGDVLTRYIQANIEGIRWALNPANKAAMVAILAERLKLANEVAAESFTFSQNGFAADSKFDLDGFKNSLKLRAEMLGTWGGTPPAPDKYLDFSYYQRALASM